MSQLPSNNPDFIKHHPHAEVDDAKAYDEALRLEAVSTEDVLDTLQRGRFGELKALIPSVKDFPNVDRYTIAKSLLESDYLRVGQLLDNPDQFADVVGGDRGGDVETEWYNYVIEEARSWHRQSGKDGYVGLTMDAGRHVYEHLSNYKGISTESAKWLASLGNEAQFALACNLDSLSTDVLDDAEFISEIADGALKGAEYIAKDKAQQLAKEQVKQKLIESGQFVEWEEHTHGGDIIEWYQKYRYQINSYAKEMFAAAYDQEVNAIDERVRSVIVTTTQQEVAS